MTPKPDRPPMDGDRTDNIGMMSTNIMLEHGSEDGGVPAMGMDITMYDLPWDMVFEEPYVKNHSSMQRADVYNTILDHLESTYKAKPGYFVEWDLSDIDERDGQVEMYARVEFGCLEGYQGDESLDDWAGRVIMNTPFYPIYNMFIILFDGRDELVEALQLSIDNPSA